MSLPARRFSPRVPPILIAIAVLLAAGCGDGVMDPERLGPEDVRAAQSPSAPVVNVLDDNDDGLCDDTHCSLREAIAFAGSGATITFSVTGTIFTSDWLFIDKSLTIQGPAGGIAIDGPSTETVFITAADFHVSSTITVTISNLTIQNAERGVQNQDGTDLTLEAVTVSGHLLSTGSAFSRGAGVFNDGTLTILNSTISGNRSLVSDGTAQGGGLYNTVVSSATVQITNSTITDNSAEATAGGSIEGGGIVNDGSGTITLTNTIVAGNTAAGSPDISGPVTATYSLVGTSDGGHGVTGGTDGNLVGVDPLLDVLADNGGPTQTHALQSGSPAIDAGNNADCPALDQRGITRPQGAVCDMGSFELEGGGGGDPTTPFTVLQTVLAELEAFAELNAGTPVADQLYRAIDYLELALSALSETGFAQVETNPFLLAVATPEPADQIETALDAVKDAVDILEDAVEDGDLAESMGSEWLDLLVGAARQITVEVIDTQEQNGQPVTEAKAYLDTGDAAWAEGRYKDAVAAYVDAAKSALGERPSQNLRSA